MRRRPASASRSSSAARSSSSAGSTCPPPSPTGSPRSAAGSGRCSSSWNARATTASCSCSATRCRLGCALAFDFRDPSWAGADVPVRVDDLEADAPYRYLRLREPPYDDDALAREAARIAPLLDAGIEVHCFVNRGEAPDHSPGGEPTAATAQRLLRLLGR